MNRDRLPLGVRRSFIAAVNRLVDEVGYDPDGGPIADLIDYARSLTIALDEIAAAACPSPERAAELAEVRQEGRETFAGAWGRVLSLRAGEFGADCA